MLVIKPHNTNKSVKRQKQHKYTFIVERKANKSQIKKEITATYGVQVQGVNIQNYKAEAIRRYTRTKVIKGKKARYKKAEITLPEGQFIDLYAN